MILYHGSLKKFDTFEIDEKYLRTNKDNLMEGQGIYLTENKEIAKNYSGGSYVYVVEVNDNDIMDFTDENVILTLLNDLGNKVDVNFEDYFDVYNIIDWIISGNLSITKLYHEIQLQLDANEIFYTEHDGDIESILEKIEKEYNNLLADILKYNDKSLGVVYICIKNPEILKIIDIIDIENNTEAKIKRLIKKT